MKNPKIFLLCLAGGLILAFTFGRHEWQRIETTPDSKMYHFAAVNLLQGKGFYLDAIGSLSDYNSQTVERFAIREASTIAKPSFNRMPGYPLFLLLVYKMHGVDIDKVLPYQIFLSGLTGFTMVLTGWLLYGRWGGALALIAVLAYGMNR